MGVLSDDDLSTRLTGSSSGPDAWRADLEARYRLGDVAPHLPIWGKRVPVWMLSNHRTDWLLSRLARFGVRERFDRVLVSDVRGAMKPDPRAFHEVIAAVRRPEAALFVDDQQRHVDVARSLGLRSVRADASASWLREVDRATGGAPAVRMPSHQE